jgi:hypothetical protein
VKTARIRRYNDGMSDQPKRVAHSDPIRLAVYMIGGGLVGAAAGQRAVVNLADPWDALAPYPQIIVGSAFGLLCYLTWRLIGYVKVA